jgi:hypothetical protein
MGEFNGLRDLFGTSGTEAQSILPSMQPTPQNSNVNEFDPNVCGEDKTFGFAVNAGEFSDPELTKTCGASTKEPCGDSGHHLRFWPLKDATGAVVANTYLLGMDSNNVNFDYNDDVYLITNIAPIPLTP